MYDLNKHYQSNKKEILKSIDKILNNGVLEMGEEVEKFEEKNSDYLSNVNKKIDDDWIYDPCGFPSGFAVEVFTFNALENAWKNAKKLSDREHPLPLVDS